MIQNQPPTLPYNGLTVVLSNPSRKDVDNGALLSGNAGIYFDNCLKQYGLKREACNIVVQDNGNVAQRPFTTCILALGEPAMHRQFPDYKNYYLGEQRGYPLRNNRTIGIASYLPQDTMDMVDYESRFNPLAQQDTSGEDEDDIGSEKQHHGRTARSNYRFWLRSDIRKCSEIIKYGQIPNNIIPEQPKFIIYPKAEEAIRVLTSSKDMYMDFDIEVDTNLNITVFSFSFDSHSIWTIPCIRWNYQPAYGMGLLSRIFRALIVAMRDNITVCHNGWAFDLFVLAWKYRLPIGKRHYDTLLAQHRCFPVVEKSLGHCMSYWLWLPFHKDTAMFNFHTIDQERKHWQYNANDVWGMKLVRLEQQRYALADVGLCDSIEQANDMIYPFLLSTLQGIAFDSEQALRIRALNDRWMAVYIKMIKVLAGREILPTSTKAVPRYFHEDLGYKIVGRGKGDNASLDEKNMLKLKLKYPDNKVLDLILAYRQKSKESGALKVEPWRQQYL